MPYVALSAVLRSGSWERWGRGPIAAVFLMLIGFALPFVLSDVARGKRKAFDRQLPDVLATIASTLRAGHGLRIALRAVADDGGPPASEEFSRVLQEERFGRPSRSDRGDVRANRVEDLDYVATAINVQSQAGGSLASLFDTLSETVRERQRHARKVRALTSMGRTSAMILIGLPFGLAALMTLVSPGYMTPLSRPPRDIPDGLLPRVHVDRCLLLKRIVTVRY